MKIHSILLIALSCFISMFMATESMTYASSKPDPACINLATNNVERFEQFQKWGKCLEKKSYYLNYAKNNPDPMCFTMAKTSDTLFQRVHKSGTCPEKKSFYLSYKEPIPKLPPSQQYSAEICTSQAKHNPKRFKISYEKGKCPKTKAEYLPKSKPVEQFTEKECEQNSLKAFLESSNLQRDMGLFKNKASGCQKDFLEYLYDVAKKMPDDEIKKGWREKESAGWFCHGFANNYKEDYYKLRGLYKYWQSGKCRKSIDDLLVELEERDNKKYGKQRDEFLRGQGDFIGMSQKNAFTKYHSELNLTFMEINGNKINWKQAIEICAKHNMILPSFSDFEKHNEIVHDYNIYTKVNSVPEFTFKHYNDRNYISSELKGIQKIFHVSDKVNAVAFIGGKKPYFKQTRSGGINNLVCKKATKAEITASKEKVEKAIKEKAETEAAQLKLAKSKGYNSYEEYRKAENKKIRKQKQERAAARALSCPNERKVDRYCEKMCRGRDNGATGAKSASCKGKCLRNNGC